MILNLLLQVGISIAGFAETVYTSNFGVNIAVEYTTDRNRTHRAGYFYQQAQINGEGNWTRQGAFIDVNLANVDNIAIFYIGARYGLTQNQFYEFTPHFSLAWRFNRFVEVPIQITTYNSRMVASIGIRGMLRFASEDRIYYRKRRALQQASKAPVFTHQ